MNPKLERDPYLRPVVRRWGQPAAIEAGWFDDGDRADAALDDVGWLCTPVDALTAAVRARPPSTVPVVLLSTGGFFPVHDGHLAMMDAARRHLDDDRHRVVGGYLSPAHDDYVRLKCATVDEPVSTRLARADAAVAGTGWLAIDPWEALARRVAVSFTDVTARLEAYLRHHVDPGIDVVYVCGGDNARFALAYTERGGCVVVGRPGSEAEVERWRTDPRVAGNPRIHWLDGDDPSSSRTLRAPTRTSGRVGDGDGGRGRRGGDGGEAGGGPPLALRLEDERAVRSTGLPAPAWRRFQDALRAELAPRVALATIRLEDQDDRAPVAGTVSLDPMLPAEIDLGVSRRFDLGGYRARGHVARPGTPPLPEQLAAIPPGRWTLRDDDRATGATVRFVTEHLPAGVELVATTFALDPARSAAGDVADSRDFLLGTDDGGLVIALPGGATGRAPYLLPYVDPAVRCGLPGGDALAFSLAVWDLNVEAFADTALTVADLPSAAARTLTAAGFSPTTSVRDVARRHAAVLRALLPDG